MRTPTIRVSRRPPTKPGAARKRALLDTSSDKRSKVLKRTEQELKNADDYAQAIVEAVPPLLVLDSELRVLSANESFYKHFRLSPPQTENCLVYELGNGQWNIPKLRNFLEEVLPRHTVFKDFEVTHTFESIGCRMVLVSGHQVDHLDRILLFLDDITERVESRAAMRASEIRYRRLFEAARDGILILDPETRRITDANPFMTEPSRVRVWFKDNGIGIAPENRERIFRLFERIHPATEYEGTGIGLTIVRKAIDRMGAQVGFESELGKGSQFWIKLAKA